MFYIIPISTDSVHSSTRQEPYRRLTSHCFFLLPTAAAAAGCCWTASSFYFMYFNLNDMYYVMCSRSVIIIILVIIDFAHDFYTYWAHWIGTCSFLLYLLLIAKSVLFYCFKWLSVSHLILNKLVKLLIFFSCFLFPIYFKGKLSKVSGQALEMFYVCNCVLYCNLWL